MNRTLKIFLFVLLADFIAVNVYVLWNYDIVSIFEVMSANAVVGLAAFDLVIALGIGCGWMVLDAHTRQQNPWGYVALTMATGSIGLLAYLIRRR